MRTGARIALMAGLVVAGVGAARTPALAQAGEPRNFSVERFRLALDANGVLDVESGFVPPHMSFDAGLWFGYADDPLVLDRRSDDDQTREGELVGSRLGAELVLSLALFDWVQLGLDIPVVFFQDRPDQVPGVNGLPDLGSAGIGAARIVPKIRILDQRRHGVHLAAMPTFVTPALQDGGYFGQDTFMFEPELAASRSFGLLVVAANLGYRVRREEQFADLEVDDEIFARIGGGVRFEAIGGPPLGIDLSLAGATAAEEPLARGNRDYGELLGGVRYNITRPLLAFAGTGVGLNRGFGTPDWRAFLGLRWTDQSADVDDDGIQDRYDACPETPEDVDGFQDADGCPDLDNDGDRVLDVDDGAPMRPEDYDQFEDEDGVPDPDNDKDGVMDWDDKCRDEPGPIANRGCPDVDTDGDGFVDRKDACPKVAEDFDGFEDSDGCPDPDDDLDGVADKKDACPRKPGPSTNRGCPDTDLDKDTVIDREDNCPDVPGDPANRGCPKPQLVEISTSFEVPRLETLDKVYFATGRADIKKRSHPLLKNIAEVLKKHPEITLITVEGHTDSTGPYKLNVRLSGLRAQEVVKFLVKEGVEEERLKSVGYGPDRPIASNKTRTGRAANRRVDFKLGPDPAAE